MTRYPEARASLSSGLPGSVMMTMRWVGSIPGAGERVLVGATLGVCLDRGAGLARDHDDRTVEPVGQGGPYLVGMRGVQHGELDAGSRADDLGRQRRAAHAAQDDMVDALFGQVVTQGGHLSDEGS